LPTGIFYKPGRLHERQESECFKRYAFDELKDCPGFNLDFWADLRDESLEDVSSLHPPREKQATVEVTECRHTSLILGAGS